MNSRMTLEHSIYDLVKYIEDKAYSEIAKHPMLNDANVWLEWDVNIEPGALSLEELKKYIAMAEAQGEFKAYTKVAEMLKGVL